MDANALRLWGIVASSAAMIAALAIAVQTPSGARAEQPVEVAQTQAAAEPVAFLVRFRGNGPIARAQGEAGRGRMAEAGRQVEFQLRRQTDFQGLCFDRFTAGGAETVLRTCAAIVASEREAVQQRWLARLRAMRAVEYVDANATATRERAG
jgi:hypothetical protein